MEKLCKIRLLCTLILVMILISFIPLQTYANNRTKMTLRITQNPVVGETITVNASASSDVKKVTWTLMRNNKSIKNDLKKNGGTFIPTEAGIYILTCTVSGKNFSETYTEQIIVSETVEITPPQNPIIGEETGTSEETDISKEPDISEKPDISEEPDISDEPETSDDTELKIILSMPETTLINVPFQLSIATSNCAHIEWYINGDYYSKLAGQINPEGTLQFSTAGTYKITVIGYTQDWNEHVKDSKTIVVCDDSDQQNGNAKEHNRAMYSWNHNYIYKENDALLQKAMELTKCNILYQELSSTSSENDVADFLRRRGECGQTVYYLCGDASWGIEKNAESMLKQIARVVTYNNAAGDYKFAGIQFDVEPYCLADFDANADAYMAQYVENCKLAYKAAHEAGLLVEVCIPYWWDSSYGYYEQLEDIIANACDSIAVMNYYKDKESSHIETEVNLCKKYNKKIINITEMQAPGFHGLTEKNTYYNDGIIAVENMWNYLDGYFEYENLGYSYHYLDVIIDLLSLY